MNQDTMVGARAPLESRSLTKYQLLHRSSKPGYVNKRRITPLGNSRQWHNSISTYSACQSLHMAVKADGVREVEARG